MHTHLLLPSVQFTHSHTLGTGKGAGGTVGTEEILWVLRRDSGY